MIEGLPVVLERDVMESRSKSVLHRGGFGNPDVFLVPGVGEEGRPVVVKDYAPRSAPVRKAVAPLLLRREALAYQRLAEVRAVPRLLGRVDSLALVFEYRPGRLLSRSLRGTLPDAFLPELEAAVCEMHACGVVHLDLRHRSNILAGDDGHPVLIDFASALRFDASTRLGRLAVEMLSRIDLRALDKWRVRIV